VTVTPEFPRAARLRSNAAAYGIFAANAVSPSDRELLLRMQRSRTERARHEEWASGLPPMPSVGSKAVAVPRR
jgi:hypothetical protein